MGNCVSKVLDAQSGIRRWSKRETVASSLRSGPKRNQPPKCLEIVVGLEILRHDHQRSGPRFARNLSPFNSIQGSLGPPNSVASVRLRTMPSSLIHTDFRRDRTRQTCFLSFRARSTFCSERSEEGERKRRPSRRSSAAPKGTKPPGVFKIIVRLRTLLHESLRAIQKLPCSRPNLLDDVVR